MMHIIERRLILDEFNAERFEPFERHPFLAGELMRKQMSHYIVLDIVGALAGSQSNDLVLHTERLIARRERAIVINLKSVTKVDDWGLGTLVRCYINIAGSGGDVLLANPSKTMCKHVGQGRWC